MDKPQRNVDSDKQKNQADMKKYAQIAFVAFVTFCCCILFFFFIYRYNGFASYWQKLMGILQPIIMGFVIAYLTNPIMMFLEKHLLTFLRPRMKSEKTKKTARTLGTVGALLFFVLMIFLLLDMMIPELIKSVQNLVTSLPKEANDFVAWIQDVLSGDSKLAELLGTGVFSMTDYVENLIQGEFLPMVNKYFSSITTGVITITTGVFGVLRVFFNFVVGLVIAIYLLLGKETFIGQGKKMVYTLFSPKQGNRVIHVVRVTDKMFGGFISGKILDSAIIGVICYIGLVIMGIPYSLLVAVIVGVTNVVPFFGPYVGAAPSFVLIALAEPVKGLYFLIFIVVLQQIDGNIIGPKILGESTGLSSFWVVFAILVGGGLFGFLGMLLGVPAFAVIYYLIREIAAYILRRRRLPEDTREYIQMKNVDLTTGSVRYGEDE